MKISLNRIYPNPDQPRKIFDEAKLQELALSIKEHGLIEPLVVVHRSLDDKEFMIVAGERRWRACQLAGLTTVPVRRLEADDNQIAEMALIENIQREDLKPLEELGPLAGSWKTDIPSATYARSSALSIPGKSIGASTF